MESAGPNAEQITYWNEQAGPKWVAAEDRLDAMIGIHGEVAMLALGLRPGEHVLDVGCGCGGTSLALGRRVGPSGRVTGIDISTPMLARARVRAAAAALPHVGFVEGDAQTHRFAPATADAVFSRFGVMFFVDPVAAFRNLRQALRSGGRVAFVCWQPLTANAWMTVPLMAIAQHVALPPPPAPDAPGPFSLGDRDRVRTILSGAGFTDVAIEALTPPLVIAGGGTIDEAVMFALEQGPLSRLVIDTRVDVRAKVGASVREALAPYATPAGVVMPSAAWVVTAR